jgi:hypothetical protein
MRTLAFYFSSEPAAKAAAAALRDRTRPEPAAIDTAPLTLDDVEGTLLAVTIDEGRHAEAIEICLGLGGRVVADVPEEWTRPRYPQP